MTWLSYLRGVMRKRGEKRGKGSGQQGDEGTACPSGSATTSSTATTTTTISAEPPPLIIPLLLTSAPPSQPPQQRQGQLPPRKPPLPRVPTDIITATEKGMIGGSLCLPSSSSTASSQGHEFEARDVVGYAEGREGTVLTRAEEACGGEGRKASWTGERGRCVMFKGVDV